MVAVYIHDKLELSPLKATISGKKTVHSRFYVLRGGERVGGIRRQNLDVDLAMA